jgi:hypothetical protein
MDAYYRQREPRTADTTHAKRADPIRPKATTGGRIVQVARSLVGCHYLNGAYGATPGGNDGTPCRPGGVQLVADPKRLDPIKQPDKTRDLAVLAAQMAVKRHCVCGGNHKSFRDRDVSPSDRDLNHYLDSLKGQHPTAWTNYFGHYTPRRVYGPAPGGSDIGGKLVWGWSCKGVRHFDCIGFISYCLWQVTEKVIQLEIAQWRTPNQPMIGSKVYNLPRHKPDHLMDADILVKADHHIAWVDASGTIIEAADTDVGVVANGRFDPNSPGDWTHLVRLPL